MKTASQLCIGFLYLFGLAFLVGGIWMNVCGNKADPPTWLLIPLMIGFVGFLGMVFGIGAVSVARKLLGGP